MTQKRILRAISPKVARERGLRFRDAFRKTATDIDDPDAAEIVLKLTDEDPEDTALELFGIANQLIEELVAATGTNREAVIAQLRSR